MKVPANIKLDEDVKKCLQTIAEAEHRSLSNLISKILIGWLKNYQKNTIKPSE